MSAPPMAGPTMRIELNAIELSAMAFMRDSRGTELPTSTCRSGLLRLHATPVRNENTYRCHTARTFARTTAANANASATSTTWSSMSRRRRSNRSAITPLRGADSIGTARTPITSATCTGDFVMS